jgi:hypothetical protein
VSLYGPCPIKRARHTRAELEGLDQALAMIVQEIEPATVRQVFYQAVVRGMVPKDESRGYKLVQRRLVKLREMGEVPYGWITDNVRVVRGPNRYGGPDDYARVAAVFYRRDYWADSPVNVGPLKRERVMTSWMPSNPTIVEKFRKLAARAIPSDDSQFSFCQRQTPSQLCPFRDKKGQPSQVR